MEKPAIAGGKPVRETYLSYGRQYVDDQDIAAVADVLKSDFLTCGPKVHELEAKLCSFTGANYATAVSSGTAALHMACMAAGIGEGDEVIVPPITFAATANSVLYCGGKPVFADIDEKTWQISFDEIKKNINPATKAVIAVDYTGTTADLFAIKELCRQQGLVFIEDAAHSIGTTFGGEQVGSIADMTVFSFHPVKTVTSGEGGAVLTNDENYQKLLQLYSKHGITRDASLLEDHSNSNWYYEQISLGYNYRITDMQCALLISQLDKLHEFGGRRAEIAKKYEQAFGDMPQVILQQVNPLCLPLRHLFVIRLDLDMLKAGRKEIYDALQAENIGVNVHYIPTYKFPYYKSIGYEDIYLENSEALYESIITLPLFYSMTDKDIDDVIGAVRKVLEYYTEQNA